MKRWWRSQVKEAKSRGRSDGRRSCPQDGHARLLATRARAVVAEHALSVQPEIQRLDTAREQLQLRLNELSDPGLAPRSPPRKREQAAEVARLNTALGELNIERRKRIGLTDAFVSAVNADHEYLLEVYLEAYADETGAERTTTLRRPVFERVANPIFVDPLFSLAKP